MKPVPLSEIELQRADAFVAALKVALAPMRPNVDASSRDARRAALAQVLRDVLGGTEPSRN